MKEKLETGDCVKKAERPMPRGKIIVKENQIILKNTFAVIR